MEKATYKNSGVDLDVYAESMSRLPKLVSRTFSPRVLRLDGGFAGLFQLNGLSKDGGVVRKYDDPVLVSCTDGVGTKIKIACMTNRHSDVGIDLVAMSVNDAICCGAEPLFFLDYVACPKDDPDLLEILGLLERARKSVARLLAARRLFSQECTIPASMISLDFVSALRNVPRLLTVNQFKIRIC